MYKRLFYFLLLLYNSEENPIEIQCPEYCSCDYFESFRRATCQNKRLYSIELNMPSQVQVLDLSHNQISELGMNVFLELKLSDLKLLNISNNKISQIHLYGFEGLSNLKSLDLSFNMVQYFHEQWFVSLKSLQELYLRGNNLQSINHEPRLNLRHLRILDISLSKIESLRGDVFSYLSNLEVLDISDNFLVHLEMEMIRILPKLKKLLVEHNNLECEEAVMKQINNYTMMHDITYRDSCEATRKSHKVEKFQRMVNLNDSEPGKNNWIYDEDEAVVHTKIIEICSGNRNNETEYEVKTVLLKIINLYPSLVLLMILITGMFTGIVIGCACQFEGKKQKRHDFQSVPLVKGPRYLRSRSCQDQNTSFRPRAKSTSSRKTIREDKNVLLMHEMKLSDSTPVLSRKLNI